MPEAPQGDEEQKRAAPGRRRRFGAAGQDLATYLAERRPETASDWQDAVEQWLSDNGGNPS